LKVPEIIARCIFILSLPVLFLTASLALGFNSQWLLNYGFNKYKVSLTTGLPNSELEKIAGSWVNYINSGDEYWDITVTRGGDTFELFTLEEKIHFKDVKDLIWLDYRALIVSLLVGLSYSLTLLFWRKGKYRRYLARSLIWGSGLSLLLIIVIGIGAMLDFDRLFLQFHFLAFTNEHWSARGYMLLLFPGGFWFDATLICAGFFTGLSVATGVLSAVYLRLTGRKQLSE